MVTEFGDMGSTRALINSMLQRYSVTFYENKTVALFDIVKFSVHSQFEQITQLSALSHYLKLAERRCQALKMPLSLQMSTVGDGFYVWNKFEGVKADLALYHAVSLALTYNYAARTITHAKSIPRLRCCIHSGSYYEYYQATAEMSTASPYIVGDVTIELARIISYTLSGQILIGSHVRELADNDRDLKEQFGVDTLDTLSFMSLAQLRAEHLIGSPIPGGRIEFLNLFLTGPRSAMNEFSIKTYHLKDKHGLDHRCFNARLQVKSSSGNQIAVGLIGDELEDFKADTYEFEDIRIVVE